MPSRLALGSVADSQTLSPLGLAAIASSGARWASKKAKIKGVFMIMNQDVEGLGSEGAVVAVSSEFILNAIALCSVSDRRKPPLTFSEEKAQKVLLPKKLARYVPVDSRGKHIWPESFVERALEHQKQLEESGGVTMTEEARRIAERELRSKEFEAVLEEEAAQLRALGGEPLRFKRIATADSESFFGSISPGDVVEALREKQIFVDEASIVGERIRTFGTHRFTVKLGDETTYVEIVVEKDITGPQAATEKAT